MRRSIFIGRFEPYHYGHDDVVKEMDRAQDVDEIIIGIGSAQYGYSYRNPFTVCEREDMITRSILSEKPYHLIRINDIHDNGRWVSHTESLSPEFRMVYSGNALVRHLFCEKGYEVRMPEINAYISGSDIRRMMVNGGNWQDFVPEGTKQVIEEINGVQRLRDISMYVAAISKRLRKACDYKTG